MNAEIAIKRKNEENYGKQKKWNRKNIKHHHTKKGLLGRKIDLETILTKGKHPNFKEPEDGKLCCICGFKAKKGVIFEHNNKQGFVCERDVFNRAMFYPFVRFTQDGLRLDPEECLEKFL